MGLIKSKERVSKHGEVFTPKNIVCDMIALIPDTTWSDIRSITLEPTCGNGNFIVEIVKKKIECGMSIYDSLNTTFGMDIMKDNIEECRLRLVEVVERYYKREEDKFFKCVCVIVNNIFVVKDSLEYIRSKKFEDKKFFELDTTHYVPKRPSIFEEEPQTLLQKDKMKIQLEAKTIIESL